MAKYEWLDERTIILAPTGSYAYGTNTEDSDHDYKGVCIPPIDFYLGLESFNEYNNTGGKNFKNTKDDVDINIIHINKFVKDAMQGVPNNIEILFLEPEQYLKVTPLGQKLIDNRHLFLSKQIKNKFGGYAKSQMQKMKSKNSNGAARNDLVEKYGYDTKFFMHSVRLLKGAIEILETKDFKTYKDQETREYLLECRNGKYSFDEAIQVLEFLDVAMNTLFVTSDLKEKPDYDEINKLLIEINKEALYL